MKAVDVDRKCQVSAGSAVLDGFDSVDSADSTVAIARCC